MEVIPAIDLRGGHVVRLLKGEYDQETRYSNDPASIAQKWKSEGARTLHLVDLDGARDGEIKNRQALESITKNVHILTQLGGGLRDMSTLDTVLTTLDIEKAILGSVLLEKPGLVVQAAEKYPHRIMLGIDARDGLVATHGWRSTSTVKATELVNEFRGLPVRAVIYTDISRDGTLIGPNIEAALEMASITPFPVVVSGGIGSLDDIHRLAQMSRTIVDNKIVAVIVGKALYEGKFTLKQAIDATKNIFG